MIAAKLHDTWRQPIIVENRGGAVGMIGVDYVAKSAPDGHTMVINAWSIVAVPQMQRTPYDVLRDLVGVVQTAEVPFVLAASLKSGISTIGELIEIAKKEPGPPELRQPRQRHWPAPVCRVGEERRQDQPDERSVQGRRSGAAGAAQRRG